MTGTLIERLEARHRLTPTGCWEWTGSGTLNGYGQISVDDRKWYVHRLAWTLLRGPIPRGMVIDHLCRNHACFNPDHLRVVTQRENLLSSPLTRPAIHAAKPCCPRCGGPYTIKRIGPRTQRYCRACQNERARSKTLLEG